MKHLGVLFATPVLAAAISPSAAPAQSQAPSPPDNPSASSARPVPSDLSGASYKTHPVPQVEVLTPFPTNPALPQRTDPLTFVPQDQISASDRAVIASTDARVRDEATLAGFEFGGQTWGYQQLLCKALPGHVFLIYRSSNGPGDVSLFSAAIPLGGKGHVSVIPIERRGYSLFSPASVNGLTVAAFNRIRADEAENKSADWLATALCYAALAGAHPALSTSNKDASAPAIPLIFPPTLEIGDLGASTVRFVDVATAPPSEWALTFSQNGQLLKVDHFATPNYAVTPIPPK